MENRFGFKDLILTVLMVVTIVMVGASMFQFDRQFKDVITLKEQMSGLTSDLNDINKGNGEVLSRIDDLETQNNKLRKLIAAGVKVTGSVASGAVKTVGNNVVEEVEVSDEIKALRKDPFYRLKQMKKMPGYAQGGHYIGVFAANVPKLTPFISGDLYSMIVQSRIFETLATYDPETLEVQGLLAKSWDFDEEKLELTFKLRKTPRFSNGSPLTSADVVYTFDLIMDENFNADRYRSNMKVYIESVVALDKHTVRFKFKKKYFDIFGLAATNFPIISKDFYSQYPPKKINQIPGLVMGTGPYRLDNPSKWKKDELITLYRNERYWGEAPSFDTIVYKSINSDTTRKQAFINGEIDVLGVTARQFDELRSKPEIQKRAKEQILRHKRQGYSYVAWNQMRDKKPTPFADKRVRQAMTYLIDRERICRESYRGYAMVTTGPFNELGTQANPNIKPRKVDVAKAIALLKAAGYEDRDNDGVVEDENGKPFEFEFVYGSGSEFVKRVTLGMKDDLAKAKVLLKPTPLDWPIMLNKMNTREFDAITLRWSASLESDIYQMFHSSQIKDNGDNFMSYSNPELDNALEAAREEVDFDKRMALWQKCHSILYEDQPYTFTVRSKSLSFLDKRFKNIKKTNVGLNFVQDWPMSIPFYISTPDQKSK